MQRPRRIGCIGYQPPGVSAESDRLWAQFVRWIGERGYVEGRNAVFERRVMSATRAACGSAALLSSDAAARSLGIRLIRFDMDAREDFDRTTAAIERERPDALVIAGSSTTAVRTREIAGFAIRIKLPVIATTRIEAAAGALLGYGANFDDLFYRAALYVARILDGAKPADLPVEQPTKFEFVVNLRTARLIGITLPASLLLRADEVIDA